MPWAEVAARESLKRGLARLVVSKRIGGTYLFYGPPGCEQESLALGFAYAILCERNDGDFCGVCRTCRRAGKMSHPDLFILDPDKAFYSIDRLRTVRTVALSTPMEADWKIFILRQADRMQDPAANSLLKTLEEPYDHSLFILVTERISGMLPTIVSRCQRIRVAPLAPEELAKRLIYDKKISEQEAQAVARLSGGRPGFAKQISDKA